MAKASGSEFLASLDVDKLEAELDAKQAEIDEYLAGHQREIDALNVLLKAARVYRDGKPPRKQRQSRENVTRQNGGGRVDTQSIDGERKSESRQAARLHRSGWSVAARRAGEAHRLSARSMLANADAFELRETTRRTVRNRTVIA